MFQTTERPAKTNRDTKLLETRASPTKQSSEARPNRDKSAFSSSYASAPVATTSRSREILIASSNAQQSAALGSKKRNRDPLVLLRLKRDPTDCFLALTKHFNRTMLRLKFASDPEPLVYPERCRRASPPAPTTNEEPNSAHTAGLKNKPTPPPAAPN